VSEESFREEVQANLRRNYLAHLAHGLLGQTGFRLLNAPTFIPFYVFELSGSSIVVGLARGLQALGMALTPIFAASVVEHRRKVLPTGFVVGALMRVQVLGIALAGFFLPREWNAAAVCALLGFFGFFLGMQGVIFNTLVSKVIPVERRGFLMGLRNFLAGITAAFVGRFGGWLIDENVLGNGYASTFLLAFALTTAGLLMLTFVREPDSPSVRQKSRVGQRIRELPALLRGDRAFTFYFIARALGVAGRMAMPFYILYAGTRQEITGVQLGQLTAVFALSQSTFQLAWGVIADRTGFRVIFLASLGVWIAAALLLVGTESFTWILVSYAGIAAGLGGFMMSSQNLVLEFGQREDIPMQIAVANTTSEALGVVGPIVAGIAAASASYTPVILAAVAFKVLAFGIMLFGVDEPRRRAEVV
jgi:MFS family permease